MKIYERAIAEEARISDLTRSATRENLLQTTRDWSFLAERHCGKNWFLVGEAAGFADPILSAGVTMAHIGGKQLAATILELDKGVHKANWLNDQYSRRQSRKEFAPISALVTIGIRRTPNLRTSRRLQSNLRKTLAWNCPPKAPGIGSPGAVSSTKIWKSVLAVLASIRSATPGSS